MPASGMLPSDSPAAGGRAAWQWLARLARMTRKELRETLRDRRTILTLVLMPLLLYPLLSMAFKQLFARSLPGGTQSEYRLGVRSDTEGKWLSYYLNLGIRGEGVKSAPLPTPFDQGTLPVLWMHIAQDLEAAVRNYQVDVAMRVRGPVPDSGLQGDLAVDVEFLVREDAIVGKEALAFLEKRVEWGNAAFLYRRLKALRVTQRSLPVIARRTMLKVDDPGAAVSLVALVPLVLILMTITGAVYPAIDLTAGERERGTLEVLVAAPIPRLGLLLAKYLAVLVVALLTATVNLAMMAGTVMVAGLGPLLFGERGLSLVTALEVLGLLVLFAAFFSAVMLTLTSFARSFKEAQAYLVPLMVISIAPGLAGLLPGLTLTGPLSIAPLINIVLLGRDLLEHRADAGMAAVVTVSTALYAAAAIGLAARVFAAEAVLYSSETGWSDLFRRPARPQASPSVASAMFSLALVFPAFFVAVNLLARLADLSIGIRLLLAGGATSLLFAVVPLSAARWRRFRIASSFALRSPAGWAAWPAAVLLGLSLWALVHQVVVFERDVGLVSFSAEHIRQAQRLAAEWRLLPAVLVVTALALTPAVCEELFFRGYLYGAFEARAGHRTAWLVSSLLFGVFHVVGPGAIVFERLLPSTLMGLALGFMRWRSGSVLPGILLHGLHNGFLVLVSYYEPQLSQAGWGLQEQSYLPLTWLAAAAVPVTLGACTLLWGVEPPKHK